MLSSLKQRLGLKQVSWLTLSSHEFKLSWRPACVLSSCFFPGCLSCRGFLFPSNLRFPTDRAAGEEKRLTTKCWKVNYLRLPPNPFPSPEGMHAGGQMSQEAAATLNTSSWDQSWDGGKVELVWKMLVKFAFETSLAESCPSAHVSVAQRR